ncbi:hypothetical protein, partial [Metallibacterium sp.]|uniref:hypothetical protein n=1 Tax=Metallibacterium sp. TaxID=2940281 RepID=UPI00262D260E
MQLTIGKNRLEMLGDVLLAGLEQFGHVQLGEPHGLAIGAQPDAAGAILGGVEDQAVHALAASG